MKKDEKLRLMKNYLRLCQLDHSPKVSYQTKLKMNEFVELTFCAKLIFNNDLVTPEFLKDTERLNEFIEEHIVVKDFHVTFRRLNKKDIRRREYNIDGTLMSCSQKVERVEKEFKGMYNRFAKILDSSEKIKG